MTDYNELLGNILKGKNSSSGNRFVPPDIEVFQQGQKTIVSADKLAAYINRPVKHIAKYLMHELTVPGQVSEGKIVLGGRFSFKSVKEKIDSYMKEYLFCKQCGSPDTAMNKEESNYIVKCLGCGARYPVGRLK